MTVTWLAVKPVPMVPGPASYRAHHILQPLEHLPLGWPAPNIQAALPFAGPGSPRAQVLVLLAVVAVVDVALAFDGGPYQVPQVHHVKEFTEIWFAVYFPQGGSHYCPGITNMSFVLFCCFLAVLFVFS